MVSVGDICLTPEPKGLVHVDAVGYDFKSQLHYAYVSFLFDHPSGYKQGQTVLVLTDELEWVCYGHMDNIICLN